MKVLALLITYSRKSIDRILMYIYRTSFASIGRNVIFNHSTSTFSYQNISIGNNVGIGGGASFIESISHIYILGIMWRLLLM